MSKGNYLWKQWRTMDSAPKDEDIILYDKDGWCAVGSWDRELDIWAEAAGERIYPRYWMEKPMTPDGFEYLLEDMRYCIDVMKEASNG